MDETVVKSSPILPILHFICYAILGLFLEGFLFFVLFLTIGSLLFNTTALKGIWPYFVYVILTVVGIFWLRFSIKKAFVKNMTVIDAEELRVIRDNKEYKFPLSCIKTVNITSGLRPLDTAVAISQVIPPVSHGFFKGYMYYLAFKRYYLNILCSLENRNELFSFDVTNYAGTTSLVRALEKYGLGVERKDQDIIEGVFDSHKNIIPFIIAAIMAFFIMMLSLLVISFSEISWYIGVAGGIITYLLIKKLITRPNKKTTG